MVEIIASTVDDAIAIDKCGANRIELVSALSEGGLTPSMAMIENVVNAVDIPVYVMVRPHSKSFCYSEEDVNVMLKDIEYIKQTKAKGIVFGALDQNNDICVKTLERVIEVSGELDITFHKAFDESNDLIKSIELLSKYPEIKTVLTSGGKNYILDNIEILNSITSKKNHINILIGGGLNLGNIETISNSLNTNHYHFGTAVRYNDSCNGNISEERLISLMDKLK